MLTSKKLFSAEVLKKLEPLKAKDNFTHACLIIADWLLIVLSILMCKLFANIWVYFLAVFVIGSRMRALENLVHETSHTLLFKNKFLNNFFGNFFCALPVGTSLFTYQKSHMDHHRWLGDENKDPDYIRFKKLGSDKFQSKKRAILHIIKVLLLIDMPSYLYGTIKSFIYIPNTPKKELLQRFGFYLTAIVLSTYFGVWKQFFLFWIVPYLTVFQLVRYFSEMSEHSGLFVNDDPLLMTRNNLYHPIIRFFIYPHNDAYHLIHHIFPNIPGYNLAKAHQILLMDPKYNTANHSYRYLVPDQNGKSTLLGMVVANST